jgi:hypothetical protein
MDGNAGTDLDRLYQTRTERYGGLRDREARRSRGISYARLAVFLIAAACLVVAVYREGTARKVLLWAGGAGLAAFGVLVYYHAGVERLRAWYAALSRLNGLGRARLRRDWTALPADAGSRTSPLHPYATDLDLFGRASVFQLLWQGGTERGRETLEAWLLAPGRPGDVRERQQAVAELAPLLDFRQELTAESLTDATSAHDVERFLAWAEQPGWFGARAWRKIAVAVSSAATLLLIGWALAGGEPGLWLVPLGVNLALTAVYAKRTHETFDRAFSRSGVFRHYGNLAARVMRARFGSPLLARLQADMHVGRIPADREFHRLQRLMELADLRLSALLHAPVHLLSLWDFHVLLGLEAWQASAGCRARAWIDALGCIEALAALAALLHDHPGWVLPQIGEAGDGTVDAAALGHPLLRPSTCVRNDVRVGPPGTFLLVTGSNMSGKSTLLRAIGTNVVLGQAGGPVCAGSMRLPPVRVFTSIRIQDSLEEGVSYFMAALRRLKEIVDAARQAPEGEPRLLLYLLDEVLGGTNTAERQIAVRRILHHLLACPAIGAVTTHDLALGESELLAGRFAAVHFTETLEGEGEGETLRFDYRLRPGVATSRNALRLMRMIGLGDA